MLIIRPIGIAVILSLVAGCASVTNLEEMRTQGVRSTTALNQPYDVATACIFKQIDRKVNSAINNRVPVTHTTIPHISEKYAEVIANPMPDTGLLYLIEIAATSENSSTAKIYVANDLIFSGKVAESLKASILACNGR